MSSGTTSLKDVARVRMSDEWSDYTLYERLSKTVNGDSPFAAALKSLSETEHGHYEFWRKYVPAEEPRLSRLTLYWLLFLRRFFGLTFAIRYLDRHEAKVVVEYAGLAHLIPEEDRSAFDAMVADEKEHEKAFAMKAESSAVAYISFVVLGLADALVEISGIHAGWLGLFEKTEIAGLAGIIAGGAASLAMASAAFAQAKQGGFKGSARLSAAYTGVSYFITAVILATPYFLTSSMLLALGASLTLAVIILAVTTWYSVVIQGKLFMRDFIEILLILFATTIVVFTLGFVVSTAFPGIKVL
jgi:VIT1/CCC1 family predicted Fe2+/Mn2+ transporter